MQYIARDAGKSGSGTREAVFVKGVNAFPEGLWVCSQFRENGKGIPFRCLVSYLVSPMKKGIAFFAPFGPFAVGAIRQNVGTPKKRVKK